jgi:2-oxoglutarate dehydrogenase E2 component (dihydrolipoamide succinyltransferase)
MRQAIAEHMLRSVRTSPHVTTVMEADMSRVAAYRNHYKTTFQAREGLKLTFTPFFIQAVVEGLKAVPEANSSFAGQGKGIVLHRQINIGIAVALDSGLIVPVIKDADTLSLSGLQRAVTDLAERARAGQLSPDEVQGSTFTITNHGVSGSLFATPIINQPNAGILGVGAIRKRPVVVTADGAASIAIRPICYVSFPFDHRIMDGALAARFLASVVAMLEKKEEWK